MKNQLSLFFFSLFCLFSSGNPLERINRDPDQTFEKPLFQIDEMNEVKLMHEQPHSKLISERSERIGKEIFRANCSVCHIGGTNIIIPEKNLKKNSLDANGMNSLNAITYQIINGKNGMPAFGGRLQEEEIEILASYVLKQSLTNFGER